MSTFFTVAGAITAFISALFWFAAAAVKVPEVQKWTIGGEQPWIRKAAVRNKWGAFFTGVAALCAAAAVLASK